MKQPRITILLFAMTAALITLSSCGSREVGHGVILWPDSEVIEAGQIVSILEQSSRQNSYIIGLADGSAHQLPQWRVRFFSDQAEATEFAQNFERYAPLYVRAQRTALPVRERLDRTARVVYRLRIDEEAKVLDRSPEPMNEGGLVAHWYQVLTENGTGGWVFGYYLTPYSADAEPDMLASAETEDPAVLRLLENVWRPASYVQMIRNNTIDLNLLRTEYGLFPEPESNRLRLVLPERRLEFEYREITRTGAQQYAALGSSLQISMRSNSAITIQYVVDNQTQSTELEIIEQDIEELRGAEMERRQELYAALLERGSVWVSSAYGRIELGENAAFQWFGYDGLVPTAIPRGAGNSGTVEFSIFLSPALRGSYDGVISFRFRGLDQPVHFLYNRLENGIRLSHLPRENLTRNMAAAAGTSSIVAFFAAEDAG